MGDCNNEKGEHDMLDTSGIKVTENEDGTIELFYVDYGVEQFGGRDFECTYKLDKENAEKFRKALNERYTGTLSEKVISAFTKNFNTTAFNDFCRQHGIAFDQTTWC